MSPEEFLYRCVSAAGMENNISLSHLLYRLCISCPEPFTRFGYRFEFEIIRDFDQMSLVHCGLHGELECFSATLALSKMNGTWLSHWTEQYVLRAGHDDKLPYDHPDNHEEEIERVFTLLRISTDFNPENIK